MVAGLAYYAIQHKKWPINKSLRVFKPNKVAAISFLYHTFGEKLGGVKQFLELPQRKILQIHLINTVGHRNNRLGRYEVLYGLSVNEYEKKLREKNKILFTKIKEYLSPLVSFLALNLDENVKLYISPELESNSSKQAWLNLVGELTPLFPYADWVWNPVGNNKYGSGPIPGFVHERHGFNPQLRSPCIANLDGEDFRKGNVRAWLSAHGGAKAAFVWGLECNGLKAGGDFIDPRKRINFPSPQVLKLMGQYI